MTDRPVVLQVSGISRRFGGLQALKDVSFEVRRGEILALIGPNGAGKSTLLNVITGFVAPDDGEVRFGDRSLAGLPAHAIARLGVARSFQSAEILGDMSVAENVMAAAAARRGGVDVLTGLFGRSQRPLAELRARAEDLLGVVGLADAADRSASLLTAGQQRLLAAARALANEPAVLFLDEPAAGLNTLEKTELAEVIRRIQARGTTVVFVEHDLGFVGALAERMVVLNHGQVIAQGVPSAVRADPAVQAAYLGDTEVRRAAGRPTPDTASQPLLSLRGLCVDYGSLAALDGVDLQVYRGEIVALIGANGAGKSTLLKAVAGAVRPRAGQVLFDGSDIAALDMSDRPGAGITLAPEGRALFPALSVRDNLLAGRYAHVRQGGWLQLLRPRGAVARANDEALEDVLAFFPRLRQRIDQQAGTLSGGEAQMLAIGRAMMGRPRLMMLDEPSFGLAPKVSREILEALPRLTEQGVTVLMVEQNARSALQVADRAYVIANGRLVAEGRSDELTRSTDLASAYLGIGPAEPAGVRTAGDVPAQPPLAADPLPTAPLRAMAA